MKLCIILLKETKIRIKQNSFNKIINYKIILTRMNKTIYMTYNKNVPKIVFDRWIALNKEYKIELSLDNECIDFLKLHFNDYLVDLFIKIPEGMYKADLWRLCKLYIYGGVYADIDLVPYLDIETLDPDITFYSCLSIINRSIFQAFMISKEPRSPLILSFIISFLLYNPYLYPIGPCNQMYECIKYSLDNEDIISEKRYDINKVKINIQIGSSDTNIKEIDLHFFPDDIKYNVKLIDNDHNDSFDFFIKDNKLIIKRLDETHGWGHNHYVDIILQSSQSIFLFKENSGSNNDWVTSFVSLNNEKILDSRDLEYFNNNKSW